MSAITVTVEWWQLVLILVAWSVALPIGEAFTRALLERRQS
jgi:hypothetical protein